jgi:diaminopimelate epimerase
MILDFEKWHGCRNDFVVVWHSDTDGDVVLDSIKRQAIALCDRHAGIGADGVLVLTTRQRGELTPYRLTIVNSDGSTAKNCGNGLRVAALSVLKAHKDKLGDAGLKMAKRSDTPPFPELVSFDVEGRALTCRYVLEGASALSPLVAVDMGVPKINEENPWHADAVAAVRKVGRDFGLPWLGLEVGSVDLGNPHVVVIADEATREAMLRVGPALQAAIAGLDGVNFHMAKSVKITKRDGDRAQKELGSTVKEAYTVYVWERGAGETMACGSGACALVACTSQTGLSERSEWVAVDMPGGRLYVKFEEDGEPIILAGPGAFVFSGRISI